MTNPRAISLNQVSNQGNEFSLDAALLELDPDSAVIPERRLMAEVLKRAVLDLRGDKLSGYALRHVRENARRWFNEKNMEYLFSFRSVCDQLGLNPERIIAELQEIELL